MCIYRNAAGVLIHQENTGGVCAHILHTLHLALTPATAMSLVLQTTQSNFLGFKPSTPNPKPYLTIATADAPTASQTDTLADDVKQAAAEVAQSTTRAGAAASAAAANMYSDTAPAQQPNSTNSKGSAEDPATGTQQLGSAVGATEGGKGTGVAEGVGARKPPKPLAPIKSKPSGDADP